MTSKVTKKCLDRINSKKFMDFCRPVCNLLLLSKINYYIEGDFEFIVDAVNLFEKFYEFKESGKFVSMKLRMFFKKFVIPRKLDKNKDRAKFKFFSGL